MKYKSELIHEILEQRGHEKSTLHYQSECVESWVDETKGAYPKLCDYESEWLNYICENPIGEFPYETVTTNNTATVNSVVPLAYKSAILKGNTKYRDIDTGEILETFEEGRNLELVSVKMPVLTTTGKNLFDGEWEIGGIDNNNGLEIGGTSNDRSVNYINVKPNTAYVASSSQLQHANVVVWCAYDKNKNFISSSVVSRFFTTPSNCEFIRVRTFDSDSANMSLDCVLQIEQGSIATSYEPYKSNILSCNEDVELGSVGEVKDELNLLTGQLTQRTETRAYQEGDEANSEVITDMANTRYKLPEESIKTVDLTVVNQDGEPLSKFKPIEGTMHVEVSGTPINPTAVLEVPVEAITQNLNSFIEEE